MREFAQEMGRAVNAVLTSPGRQVRTAEEMSQLAPFVDAATAIDRTNFDNTFISYYTWGEAIGLGLDLTLRERSNGRVTLDAYMRALWQVHGKPGGKAPGYVDKPYTMDDLKRALAEVSGDAAFAERLLRALHPGSRGRGLPDAARARRLRAAAAARERRLRRQPAAGGCGRAACAWRRRRPARIAGLRRRPRSRRRDRGDRRRGRSPSEAELRERIAQGKPGDELPIAFERRGERVSSTIRLAADPRREVVPIEDAGQTLTAAQRRFRDAWLGPAGR